MSNIRCLRPILILGAALLTPLAWNPSRAAAADPVAFATVSDTCNHLSAFQTFYGSPVAQAHTGVIARYTASGGTAEFDYGSEAAGPGDLVWDSTSDIGANQAPHVTVYCGSSSVNVPFTVTFYDEPQTPASFAGGGSAAVSASASDVFFTAPATGQYVADLTLTQGSVTLSNGSASMTFASSGQLPLGTLYAGDRDLFVTALDGPPARWSITIRALPVAISGLTFGQAAARPGDLLTAAYSASGQTSITANVTGPGGALARSLASDLAVSAGDHTLTWDGRDGAGSALADGSYTLTLTSRDAGGYTTSAQTAVTLDSTPPTIAVTSPDILSPNSAVTVQLADNATGVASAQLDVDGASDVAESEAGQTALSYHPLYNGWSTGKHTITVTALDGVGNRQVMTRSFTVSTAGAPSTPGGSSGGGSASTGPSCSKAAARRAILAVPSFVRAARHVVHAGRLSLFSIYNGQRILCRDLTGDGRRDMVVEMFCCTAASPTPLAIFRNTGTRWSYAFGSTHRLVYGLSTRGGDLVERSPVYRRTDPLCCPSSYRHYRLHWTGHHFRSRRGR